ncbi:DUF3472 domain-containing protein [Mucilaginibacter sp. CAU 1740]|uniref:DUF3472 domain-containing protein n=1 Tax=Mucilaginibacter sp. CAU 1740 TaxID=3140365 RepID=UPI00325B6B81
MMKKTALSKLTFAIFAITAFSMKTAHVKLKDITTSVNNNLPQTENAAPSEHIFFDFPSDAIAKIHKIKIVASADAEYFSAHNFRGGYNGLQQTPDTQFSTSNILIASLWDPNTAGKVFSKIAYKGANTFTDRFGGEGDGYKSINPYKWQLNTWYNIATRSWKYNGEFYVATFIQNTNTGVWFHTSTLAEPDRPGYLGQGNDAFLENWDGTDERWDGRFVRKAFFKDCWNLNADNVWQKHTKRRFNANENDKVRNGKYDRAFNSGYDAAEDAYFMQHGGDTQPDKAFGAGRGISLPEQAHQNALPQLTVGAISSIAVMCGTQDIKVSWTTDATKTPQLSSKIEILNASGKVLQTVNEVLPEKRSAVIKMLPPAGNYAARVTITDIFNHVGKSVKKGFVTVR